MAEEQHSRDSFVARIWLEPGNNGDTTWRGHLRHVQSKEEMYFQDLMEIREFLGRVSGVTGPALTARPLKDATKSEPSAKPESSTKSQPSAKLKPGTVINMKLKDGPDIQMPPIKAQGDPKSLQAEVMSLHPEVNWGGKLFFGVLIAVLAFFWWLLIYSGGVVGSH